MDIIIRMNFVNILECYRMEQDILQILEFNEIRRMLAQLCPSSLSKAKAMDLQPSSEPRIIAEHLQETEEASICLQKEISSPLGETYDIIPFIDRAEKEMILLAGEFMEISSSLETYQKMHEYFSGERHLRYPILEEKASLILPLDGLFNRIRQVFDDKGDIRDKASMKLSRIRGDIETVKSRIRKSFRQILHDKDTALYLQDAIITQRNGRYVVPVKEEYRYKFDGIVHDRSSTGQTLFMEPMISVRLNNDLIELILAEKQEVMEVLRELTRQIKNNSAVIRKDCHIVSDMEFIFARGQLALAMNGVRATFSAAGILDLKDARHPLIPADRVVPISLTLGKAFKILVITGSNAGGKTIAIKTVGILALMNQSGLFIPAAEGSMMPVYNHIYSIIGDDQSIQYNLSTFSSYITQLVSFLPYVNEKDLVLLDELGAGTDPIEGAMLAQAVTEYLVNKNVNSIITSHFSEMKKLAYELSEVENAFVEFDKETLSPTYHLIIGVAGNSNAFNICRQLGMQESILNRAVELQQRSPFHNMEMVMNHLNEQRKELEQEKESICIIRQESDRVKAQLQEEQEEFLLKKNAILSKMREESSDIKRNLRIQAEKIIRDVKKASSLDKDAFMKHVGTTRSAIENMKIPESRSKRGLVANEIKRGDIIYIDTLGSNGKVISVTGKKITVACGVANICVDISHCFAAEQLVKMIPQKISHQKKNVSNLRHEEVSTSVNVIGKTVYEAIPEIDKFLNDCIMAGVSPVQIIHGKGTGSLRKGIYDYLKTLPFITDFRMAEPQNGGAGVTDVYFN